MQAVERFEPEKGFRLATYAMWWIKAAIQEYIFRSWSLVKMGTTANRKKLFCNLRKAQSKISILDDGDMRLDQVKIIARRIGVTEMDVIYMNRRLSGDASLNAAIREDGDFGEWQDWLVDESPDQETTLAASEEFDNRRKTLSHALSLGGDKLLCLRNAYAGRYRGAVSFRSAGVPKCKDFVPKGQTQTPPIP